VGGLDFVRPSATIRSIVEQMVDEIRYRVLRIIEEEPQVTQRELAARLGISVGKVNYCLNALIEKGFVKAKNFNNSSRKRQYMYKLTPKGLGERTRVALSFLRQKAAEFDEIRREIERLEERFAAEATRG
jgi:MarR family transcriptional regulator, temperature-dependent positive regulator of motility